VCSCLMGRVGVGEAVNLREERKGERRHALNVETWVVRCREVVL
jgi:hypothetical protein